MTGRGGGGLQNRVGGASEGLPLDKRKKGGGQNKFWPC